MSKYRIVSETSLSYSQYRAQKRSRFGFWYTLHSHKTSPEGYSPTEAKARETIEDDRSYKRTVTIIDVNPTGDSR